MSSQQEDVSVSISFIKLVERNPCLWNYTLNSYSRTDLTTMAWKKIAEELKDTEQNCRDRWRNIRTAFGRSLKPPKSGSGVKSKKSYYLAIYLDFLRPYMKGASTSWIVPAEKEFEHETDHNTQAQGLIDEEDTPEDIIVTPFNDHYTESESEICQYLPARKRKKVTSAKSDPDKVFAEWLEMKKKKEVKTTQEELEDADWLFFRSLLPDFKKLHDKRKRHLKLKYVSFLNEELDRADAEIEASASSYSWCSTSFQHHDERPPSPSLPQENVAE